MICKAPAEALPACGGMQAGPEDMGVVLPGSQKALEEMVELPGDRIISGGKLWVGVSPMKTVAD